MILDESVEVTLNSANISYYEKIGYLIPRTLDNRGRLRVEKGTKIYVNPNDLTNRSTFSIRVSCDYCNEEKYVKYSDYKQSIEKTGNYCCINCRGKKIGDVLEEKYGERHVLCVKEFKEKAKNTLKKNYGCENPMYNQNIKNKVFETNLKKYGSKVSTQNIEVRQKIKESWTNKSSFEKNEIKEKQKASCRKNFGYDFPAQSKDILERIIENQVNKTEEEKEKIQNKRRHTCLDRYGVKNPMECDAIKKKLVNSLYENNTQATSIQQQYLHSLFGGELNYPISYYSADICLIDDKIVIEYDGGGHDLSVKMGSRTEEEFINKERKRSFAITDEGYKIIKIISRRDYLPNEERLLQMFKLSKDWFNKGHHWITFDIDNKIFLNSENQNGHKYNYEKLKRIRKS